MHCYWTDVNLEFEINYLSFKVAEDANAIMQILIFAAGKEIC